MRFDRYGTTVCFTFSDFVLSIYLLLLSFVVLVANQCGWGWDGELVHPKTTPGDGMTNFTFLNSSDGTEPSPPSGNVQETDEVRLERINGYISLLSNLQQ